MRRMVLAVLASVMLIVPSVLPTTAAATSSIAPFPSGLVRLQGADRFETAVETSKRFSPGVPVVYVATGLNFPDALSAAAAAAFLGGPLVLTLPNSLPTSVAAELDRLDPGQIYLVGSSAAISDSVLEDVSAYGPVERIGGADRYATGRLIVSKAFTVSGTVIIATGRNFPDALAATGVASLQSAPVVLVDGLANSLPTATMNLLSGLAAHTAIIAGSEVAVSAGIAQQLHNSGLAVQRYGGVDRYATAALMNQAFFATADVAFLATGENFPDALAGAALAGNIGAPLFITRRDCLPDATRTALDALSPTTTVVLGSTAAVSANAASGGSCSAPPPPPANPGDTKNCSDFAAQAEAQAWFNYYYPHYGDIAGLDADNDLIACELLP